MIGIHWALVLSLAFMTTTIRVNEVDSYPTFAMRSCQPRSYGHIRILPLRCPPCHICMNHICKITSCKPRHAIFNKPAICVTLERATQEVRCARITGGTRENKRRVTNSWQLPLKNDSSVSGVGIDIDKAGNAFVGLIDSQQLRFLIFNADNELMTDINAGSIDQEYSDSEVDAIRLADEFCLIKLLDLKPDAHEDEDHDIIKCIHTPDYMNVTSLSVV